MMMINENLRRLLTQIDRLQLREVSSQLPWDRAADRQDFAEAASQLAPSPQLPGSPPLPITLSPWLPGMERGRRGLSLRTGSASKHQRRHTVLR